MGDLTLEDIARMAGVSRATVSRVVNNQVGVRSKSRDRVLRIIEETGFQPNLVARSLASQNTYVIGHVIPQRAEFVFADPFSTRLSYAMAKACAASDYIMTLFIITSKEEEDKLYSRIANKGLLDGVIIQGGQAHSLFDTLTAKNIPFVVSGHPSGEYKDVSYVDVDNVNGAFTAVSHLLHLGRKRVATVAGSQDIIPGPGIDRLEGYRKALEVRGLCVEDELIAVGDFTEEGGYYAAENLIGQNPDAIFVASDRMATGVLRALHEAHVSVPDDVAIVGFDDLFPAMQADPPLTTVRVPIEIMGKSLVNLLVDIIEHGQAPPRQIILDTELIVRRSCGATNVSGR